MAAARRARQPDIQGDLQADVMTTVWKLGEAKVEDVRAALGTKRNSAYNTVQTVMNRLVARGLLERERRGNVFVYRALMPEAEYLARSIGERLAEASPDARRAALLNLVAGLSPNDVDAVARDVNRIRRARQKG
jgi:predicted transcriptional regulator